MPPPSARPRHGADVARGRADVARHVASALRAAARARRRPHQTTAAVLLDAFASATQQPNDLLMRPAEFAAACRTLGLEVSRADILSVYDAAGELAVKPKGAVVDPSAEDAEDGTLGRADPSPVGSNGRHARSAPLEAMFVSDDASQGADGDRSRVPTDAEALLIYRPWISSEVVEGRRGVRGWVGPTTTSEAADVAAGRTRRGPLRDTDPVVRHTDGPFVYPRCRTPVFPPRGWSSREQWRGTCRPEAALALDHVHGCGPGLVDQKAPVPIFCLAATDDPPSPSPSSASSEVAVFYAAGVGVVQRVDVDPSRCLRPSRVRRQRHFRGHGDDVRCCAVHDASRVAATGEMGVSPRAMVWSIDRPEDPPLAILTHPRGSRAVIAAAFDGEGARLATVCGDDGHAVSLWRWGGGGRAMGSSADTRAGELLWTTRGYQSTPPAVRGALFAPSPRDLLVTWGTTHVRFWTPEGTTPTGQLGQLTEETEAETLSAGNRGRSTDRHAPWRARAGRFAPRPAEDVLAAVFLPPSSGCAGSGSDGATVRLPAAAPALVTGSPSGALLVWDAGRDGSRPGSRMRIASGSRHAAAVSALALSPDRGRLLSGDAAGAVMCWVVNPTDGSLGPPLGGIWLVESPSPPIRSNLGREEDDDEAATVRWLESYPDIRGLAWSPSGTHALATSAQGSVWRIDLTLGDGGDRESGSGAKARTKAAAATSTSAVIMRGHDAALTCAAWSDGRTRREDVGGSDLDDGGGGSGDTDDGPRVYATGAASGRVVVWEAASRRDLVAFDAGGAVHAVSFSPDGAHLAAGLDGGVVNVFAICASDEEDTQDAFEVSPRFVASAGSGLKAAVGALAYSPDGKHLAAGDQLGGLELYDASSTGGYGRRARCTGHASAVLHADWSADSTVVRTGSTSRELLYHEAPTGRRLTRAPRPDWSTWTTPLGFELMGLWPKGADGTDINGVWRVGGATRGILPFVVTADDTGLLRVVNFPCAVMSAPSVDHRAHSSHVTAAVGSTCEEWIVSTGGRDCCVMQWRVVRSETDDDEGSRWRSEGTPTTEERAGVRSDQEEDERWTIDDGEGEGGPPTWRPMWKGKSNTWRTRVEVASRRRRLERELRALGQSVSAAALASGEARDRSEWQPAASTGRVWHAPRGGSGSGHPTRSSGHPTAFARADAAREQEASTGSEGSFHSDVGTFSEAAASESWLVEDVVDA